MLRNSSSQNQIDPHRILMLFLRLLTLTALFLVPLILYTGVKRNFAFVKFMSLRYLVFLGLLVWLGRARSWREFASPGRAPWLMFLFGAILSCLSAPNLTECFDVHHVPDIVALFVFFQLVFFFALRSRRFVHLSMVLLVVQIALSSVYGVLQDLGIDGVLLHRFGLDRLYFQVPNNQAVSTMGNINFAGEYQVVTFPLALAMVLIVRSRWAQVLCALVAVLADWNFVSQDTDGSNLGFFLALLVMVPLGIWIWPRRAKLLVFFTAAGFAVEGVFTVFREWWSRSYSYLLAIRNPAVNLRDLRWEEISPENAFSILFGRYTRGKAAFAENWMGVASDIWVALAIAALALAYFYGIPRLAASMKPVNVSTAEWVAQVRKRILVGLTVALAVLIVIGAPLHVHRSISKTNDSLKAGGTVKKHWYAEVQPDARHPYTFSDFFLDNVFSQWTYVFRWECWQAASANLWANSIPVVKFPLLGIGRGNFKVTHPLFASQLERKLLGAEVLARKVHNEWLAVGLEAGFFGIFGLFWLFAVFFYSGYLVVRRLRVRFAAFPESEQGRFEYYLALAAIGSLIGTAFHNSVSSNLLQPSSAVVTYWVAACLCAIGVSRRVYRATPGGEKS